MKTYSEFRPTSFDSKGLGLEDRQDWLVAPVSHTRDSGVLEECNWNVVLADLQENGSEDVEVHRFGHWGPGWFEIVLVRPGSDAAKCAEAWENCLADYPVASDDALSQAADEAAYQYWAAMCLRERIRYCKKARVSIFQARRDHMSDRVYDLVREALS